MTYYILHKRKEKGFRAKQIALVLVGFHPDFFYLRSGSDADQSQLKMKQTILGTANKGTVLREDVFDFSIESGKCHMETLLVFGKFVSV